MLLLVAVLAFPIASDAQLDVTGQWSTLPSLSPINPIHVALLNNGKVLIVSGSGNNPANTVFKSAVWNPAAGTFSQQTTPWDLFCNGMSFLPDGRVIMTGGNIGYDPALGLAYTTIFDPATEQMYRLEDMAGGRWYPSNTALNDGGTLTFGGTEDSTAAATNKTVEIYDVGGGWSGPYPADFTPGWYPRLHLLPNGKVFVSGPNAQSHTFDPATGTWSTGPKTKYGGDRLYGASVLLPLSPDDGYRPRVVIMGGNTHGATNSVEAIDLGASTPTWVTQPPMSVPRVTNNAVLLPTGKILAVGGSTAYNDPGSAHLNAETFDPVAQTWTPSGTMAYARLYHSIALLLPDATVWVAGSNPNWVTWTPQMEIYEPPYLFTASGAPAPRPTISSAPAVVGYGQTFTVSTPDAAGVSKVLLMRPGSNTHAFDMEQRLIYTDFTKGAGTLTVTAPTSTGAAPPGYYMLFILDAAGVPSVATFIQLLPNPTNQPPTAAITNPTASSVSIAAGGSVTFEGTASDPDGSVAAYAWVFPGGSPAKSSAQNPGAVTFAQPGVYTVSLTVLDDLGVNNPSPPTVTVTVSGSAPALAAAITSPASAATVSGTVTVGMSATGAQGSPTQFVLKLDNATTLSTQTITSGSAASYAWSTTGVANGTHTLSLTVTDGAGRTATHAISVVVNNAPPDGGGGGTGPSVTLSAPATGAWIGNSVRVTATASGPGLASIKIYGNGGVVLTQACSASPCTLDTWWVTGPLPNAAYQIQAVATNAAGAWTTSPPVVVNKNATSPVVASGAPPSGGGGGTDATPPTVTLTGPASGANVSGTVTVSATAGDNVGVVGVQFKVDGVSMGAEDTAAPYTIAWTTTETTNGPYTLTAVARDAAGNTTPSAPVTVTVGNGGGGGGGGGGGTGTGPAVTLSAPATGAWIGNSVRVTATATSVGVPLATIKIYGNGGVVLTQTCVASPCTLDTWWTTGSLPNAAYQIQAVATDANGAWTTTPAVVVFKNAQSPVVASGAPASSGGGGTPPPPPPPPSPPAVSITAPSEGATVSGSTTVTATASDDVGVVGVQLMLDGATLGAELTTAPYALTWDTTTATNGPHTLTAVARDGAGNTTTSAALTVTVSNGGGGNAAPVVTLTAPATGAWIGNSVRVTATATDSSGLGTITLWGNGGVFFTQNCGGTTSCTADTWWVTGPLPNAAYQIQAVATDVSGAHTISSAVLVKKNASSPVVPSGASGGGGGDPTPPTVAVTAPAGGATVSGAITVSANAGDDVGVVGVQFKLNGLTLGAEDMGAPYAVAWDTTSAANGDHVLTAVARDAAGNATTSAAVTVTVSNGSGGGGDDVTPPNVTITTPLTGAWTGNSIKVSATATDNVALASLKLFGNGTLFAQAACGGVTLCEHTAWWTTGALPPGQHTITAVATDVDGNETTSAPVTINK